MKTVKKNYPTAAGRRPHIFILLFATCLTGCSLWRENVRKTPKPAAYGRVEGMQFDNGYPKQKQLWIAYSDRDKNSVGVSRADEDPAADKKLSLLDPLMVLKRRSGMLKVAEYKPELINDGKLADRKKLKIAGWIPEERLLLWNAALKNTQTGFTAKAALVINDTDVLRRTDKYLANDSALTFNSPDLLHPTNAKAAIGQIVYIYKQSEDRERFLVGDAPSVTPDSAKSHIYGWVSKNMLSLWGQRSAVRLNAADSAQAIYIASPASDTLHPYATAVDFRDLQYRSGLENIFPLQPLQPSDTGNAAPGRKIKFFTNAFDYDSNRVYNVLGNPVYYRRFRQILADNKKLNIVFVLDVSQNNRLYIPAVKSLLQELQLGFSAPSCFSSVRFGGVVFKQNNTCGVNTLASALSGNYQDITLFFEQKIPELRCRETDIVQPVGDGLSAAAQMLSGARDETNVIILIGTTASQEQTQTVVNALTQARARAILFQTQSKSADAYNDFVLLAARAMVGSAQNITELKKEKIVDQQDVLTNNTYSLAQGASGVYFLDYPKGSMTEGFVIFPDKGETEPASVLKTAVDSLLAQITADNSRVDNSLTGYFRSDIGVNNTAVARQYLPVFPFSGKRIPTSIAAALLGQNAAFLFNGYLSDRQNPTRAGAENGVLLNEQEYEALRGYYAAVYKNILAGKKEFYRKKAMRQYVRMVAAMSASRKKPSRAALYRKTMNQILFLTSGYIRGEDGMMNRSLKDWKKSADISDEQVLAFFEQFKSLAADMATQKGNPSIRIYYKGQYFYWVNDKLMPSVK